MQSPPCDRGYLEEAPRQKFELPDGRTLELVPGRCADEGSGTRRENQYVRAVVRGPGDEAVSFFVSTEGRCTAGFRHPHLSCGKMKFTWTDVGFVVTNSGAAPW